MFVYWLRRMRQIVAMMSSSMRYRVWGGSVTCLTNPNKLVPERCLTIDSRTMRGTWTKTSDKVPEDKHSNKSENPDDKPSVQHPSLVNPPNSKIIKSNQDNQQQVVIYPNREISDSNQEKALDRAMFLVRYSLKKENWVRQETPERSIIRVQLIIEVRLLHKLEGTIRRLVQVRLWLSLGRMINCQTLLIQLWRQGTLQTQLRNPNKFPFLILPNQVLGQHSTKPK